MRSNSLTGTRAYEGLAREGRLQWLMPQFTCASGREPKGTSRVHFRTHRRRNTRVHPSLLSRRPLDRACTGPPASPATILSTQ